MGEVSYQDAIRVLERFRLENSHVYLSAMGFGWRLGIVGQVTRIDDGEVRFRGPDGNEMLALRLDMDDMTFWSGDPGDVPPPVRRGIARLDGAPSFVGIGLPYRVAPEVLSGPACDQEQRPRERIFFCELPEAPSSDNDD